MIQASVTHLILLHLQITSNLQEADFSPTCLRSNTSSNVLEKEKHPRSTLTLEYITEQESQQFKFHYLCRVVLPCWQTQQSDKKCFNKKWWTVPSLTQEHPPYSDCMPSGNPDWPDSATTVCQDTHHSRFSCSSLYRRHYSFSWETKAVKFPE